MHAVPSYTKVDAAERFGRLHCVCCVLAAGTCQNGATVWIGVRRTVSIIFLVFTLAWI